MNNNIIIINGPNLNLLGKREESQYGKTTFNELKELCAKKCEELELKLEFFQSNLEGEIVNAIQKSINSKKGIIINAAGFTHTSVAIRDALAIYKGFSIELHISNIYQREEFRQKSLISGVCNGIICGLGTNGYILAINAMHSMINNGN
mgnify:CR=1 FL=1